MVRLKRSMNYEPKWSDVEFYAKKLVKRYMNNFKAWKVEEEDLMQDAYEEYLKLKNKTIFQNKQHFITLYWRSLQNGLITNSGKAIRHGLLYMNVEEPIDEIYKIDFTLEEEKENFLITLKKEAPKEIKEVLKLFFEAPIDVLETLGLHGKSKIVNDEKIARFLGKPGYKFKDSLKAFLGIA